VKDLLALAATVVGPAAFSRAATMLCSRCPHTGPNWRMTTDFRPLSHACLASPIRKTSLHGLVETYCFPVPRSVTIDRISDLKQTLPCSVKPMRATDDYLNGQFARAYQVGSPEEVEGVPPSHARRRAGSHQARMGQDQFCVQYSGDVCSFTSRKLSIWPPFVRSEEQI
jgi:hypothetical protein